jgi:cytoskeletal protein RodZ
MNLGRLFLCGKKGSLVLIAIILVVTSVMALAVNARISSLNGHSQNNAIEYGRNGIHAFNDLFGNFSRMSVVLNSTTPDGSKDSLNATFVVLGIATLDRESTYEVNITGDETTNGQTMDESLVAWISTSSGQVVQTYDNENGYLEGSSAENEDNTLSMFTTTPWLSMLNSSTVAEVPSSEQSMIVGQVNMNVISYHSLPSFTAFQNWVVSVGTLGSSRLQLVVFSSFISPSTGDESSFQIVSMTPAA